jgi:hypothetical protein
MGMCICTYDILNIIKIFSVDLNGWIRIVFKEYPEYYARFELSSVKI